VADSSWPPQQETRILLDEDHRRRSQLRREQGIAEKNRRKKGCRNVKEFAEKGSELYPKV